VPGLGADLHLQAQKFGERLRFPALPGAQPIAFGVGQFVEVDDGCLDEHPAHIGARSAESRVRCPPDQVGAATGLGERAGDDDAGQLAVHGDQGLSARILRERGHMTLGLDEDAPLDQQA
jgi:hypothetical protein